MNCPNCGAKAKRNKLNRCFKCNMELVGEQASAAGINNNPKEEYKVLYKDGNVHIEATLSKEKYRVLFTRLMVSDWIRCPSCHAKMFLNRMLKGELQQKCRRCKIVVDFEFK